MKKTLTLLISLMIIMLSVTGCKENRFVGKTADEKIDLLMSGMSIEAKVGQLFMFSIAGSELTDDTMEYLSNTKAGNIIMYADNLTDAEQAKAFNAKLQKTVMKITGVPAFIALDNEGGLVTRIYNGATYYPAPMAFSATGNPENTYTEGKYMGEELRYMGFNMNLAPSVDINSNPDNPVINTRAYGDTAETVNKYSAGFIKGLQEEKIVACAKHYPGHGDTNFDSHFSLPVIDKSREELNNSDLSAFKNAVDNGVSAIMTAHILYPQIEKDGLPATMSKTFLTDILRTELGFSGLVVTDSLALSAITEHYSMGVAAVTALKAGADVILLGGAKTDKVSMNNQTDAYNAVLEAVRNGTISLRELSKKVKHVLQVKAEYGLLDVLGSEKKAANFKLDRDAHASFAKKVSEESVTVVSGADNLPINSYDTLVVTTEARVTLSDNPDEPNSVGYHLSEAMGGDHITIDHNPDEGRIDEVVSIARKYSNLIICTVDLAEHPNQAVLVNRLVAEHPNAVVAAMQSPYDRNFIQSVNTYICTYEYTPNAVDSLINIITGKVKAKGILPVQL